MDVATPVAMEDYGTFVATRTVPLPRAYLFADEPELRGVLDRLLAHGISVETLSEPLTAEVEQFIIDGVERSPRAAQGHREVKVNGHGRNESLRFPAGTFLVRVGQPLGTLAAYLLEPESDDGLVTWNVLDHHVGPGKPYPIAKLFGNVNAVSRVVDRKD
jgi:hypothetical protein